MTRYGFIWALVLVGAIAFGFWQESILAGLFALVFFIFLGAITDSVAYLQAQAHLQEQEKSEK